MTRSPWALAGPGAGLAALTSLALACALFAAFSTRRYREIARLAAEVDEVLHGGRRIDFADYREGDVAVLKNELAKMTAALAGATERLGKEKAALADALADVSHQIRTPLTAIGLLVPAIEDAAGPAERTRALRELETLRGACGVARDHAPQTGEGRRRAPSACRPRPWTWSASYATRSLR